MLFPGEASLPPGFEAGKYVVGWKPSSSVKDMRLWVFQGASCLSLSDLAGVSSPIFKFRERVFTFCFFSLVA